MTIIPCKNYYNKNQVITFSTNSETLGCIFCCMLPLPPPPFPTQLQFVQPDQSDFLIWDQERSLRDPRSLSDTGR